MENLALKLVPVSEQFELESFYQTPEEIKKEFEISSKTSIARKSVSAPLKQFLSQFPHLVSAPALNYAKGREQESKDTQAIYDLSGMCAEYDYTFCPDLDILKAHYSFVYCGYCTNVLPPLPRKQVWTNLAKLCNQDGGIVVVSARSNTDRGIKGVPEFDGFRTLRGTYQKGYFKDELFSEAKEVFSHVIELKTKGAFRMVICSHSNINLDQGEG
ncbi:hypothetical protein AAFT98_003149 [Vibrio parahaemolyticus]